MPYSYTVVAQIGEVCRTPEPPENAPLPTCKLFKRVAETTFSLSLFLFWFKNLSPQVGCGVICSPCRDTEKWGGDGAWWQVSAEKKGPGSLAPRGLWWAATPVAPWRPWGPVPALSAPHRALLLGWGQRAFACSPWARGLPPHCTYHLVSEAGTHVAPLTDEETEAHMGRSAW